MTSNAVSIFTVSNFQPQTLPFKHEIETVSEMGLASMEKNFTGDLEGRAETTFLGFLDEAQSTGSYTAIESVSGTLKGSSGTFNMMHTSSMIDNKITAKFLTIVPGSGTGDLKGITGSGAIEIDDDGTHRLVLDYEL